MENQELVVYEGQGDVLIKRPPDVILAEAQKAARALTDVIARKTKPFIVNGEQYLEYEDWQTVGKFYGLFAKTHSAIPCEINGVSGAKAEADIIDETGLIVGHAEAYCLKDEPQWANKPYFQIASMAQTRAGAKAFRNILAWVVVLAGYRPTPAEEMQGIDKPSITPPQRKSEKKPEAPEAGSETMVTGIEKVTMKTGTKDGKAWTKYTIHADKEYSTFSETIATDAKKAAEAGLSAAIEYKNTPYGDKVYANIVSLKVIEPETERSPGEEG